MRLLRPESVTTMAESDDTTNARACDQRALRIVHVMRAPVGGLFRHVLDLSGAQARAGHSVGLIVDAETGGARAETALAQLAPLLALGLRRVAMKRLPHWSDPLVAFRISKILDALAPDIVHGHGAKGGLYARLPAIIPAFPRAPRAVARVYTPHGGSLHFHPTTLVNRALIFVERALEGVTDLIPFESDFARRRFIANIGLTRARAVVAHNGVTEGEFLPLAPAPDAADFLYVGEWRRLKGIDTLLEALARLNTRGGRLFRLALVGGGPDEAVLRALAASLGVSEAVSFSPPMEARAAFRLGRVVVVPSRAESLPYIVLEAVAAHRPVVATNVGGIPEIFGPQAHRLVPDDNPARLAEAMLAAAALEPAAMAALTQEMADFVRASFSVIRMVEIIVTAYRETLLTAGKATTCAPGPEGLGMRSGDLAK